MGTLLNLLNGMFYASNLLKEGKIKVFYHFTRQEAFVIQTIIVIFA